VRFPVRQAKDEKGLMPKTKRSESGDVILLKRKVAERLRGEIVGGRLKPGEKIVEGSWAKTLGVSQASIREAVNMLATEGFVAKALGRSARVVNLSAEDVRQIYELRGSLEGLAARLAAEGRADTSAPEAALRTMEMAAAKDDVAGLLDANLRYHLSLCGLSGNPRLEEMARRLLTPLFAFIRIRAVASGQSASLWTKDFVPFRRILELIREGDGFIAEQYVEKVMMRIAATAYSSWEKKPEEATTLSRRQRSHPRAIRR
jgi:DNA-binding GntR family transcriptional regulator